MSLHKLYKSFGYAFAGIGYALKTQVNMVIHLGATILVTVAGFYFRLTAVEWAIIVLAIGLVWVAEMLNTAIEATVDLVTEKIHPIAKMAKDVAAGAVLLAAFCSVIIGILIFWPHI